MSTDTWTLSEISAAILSYRSDSAKTASQVGAGNKPPAETIEKWRSYLPDDCIKTMIEMGWDKTG
jgi:hypothetical protein